MRAFWEKLGARQRQTLIAGGILIAMILFVQLALAPFLESRKKIKRGITLNEAALKEIYVLDAQYSSLKDDVNSIQKALAERPPDFSFFSFIEKKAGETGLRGNMKSLQPSKAGEAGPFEEIAADIKFEKVTLKQIVDFLAAAEAPGSAVILKRLSLGKSSESPDYLYAQLRLSTFQPSRAGSGPAGRQR